MSSNMFRKKWKEAKWIAREVCWHGTDLTFPPGCLWRPLKFEQARRAWKSVARRMERQELPYERVGLYVHVPFCLSRCSYCSMTSIISARPRDYDEYLECLQSEMKLLELPEGLDVWTLYIGGGTPSILQARQLEKLLKILHDRFDLSNCVQKMVELSPTTATPEKIRVFKDYGFNKVTIGIQTTDTEVLKRVNRIQNNKAAVGTYHAVRKAGIPYINIDLMAGLPGQSVESFMKSLDLVLSLKPDTVHINPFYPNEVPALCRSGQGMSASELAARSKMVLLAKEKIADVLPSAFEEDDKSKENVQLYYSKQLNSSIFGLGYGAMSHVTHHLHYEKMGGYAKYLSDIRNGRFPLITGHTVDKLGEMRGYVIKNLENDGRVSKAWFRKLFGKDMSDVFKREINDIALSGFVVEDDSYWGFRECQRMYRYVLSKFFYDGRTWNQVLRASKRRPSISGSLEQDLVYLFNVESI